MKKLSSLVLLAVSFASPIQADETARFTGDAIARLEQEKPVLVFNRGAESEFKIAIDADSVKKLEQTNRLFSRVEMQVPKPCVGTCVGKVLRIIDGFDDVDHEPMPVSLKSIRR